MELLYAIKTESQSPIDLSPQQIVDCSSGTNSGENDGCENGLFPDIVDYLRRNDGRLVTEESYLEDDIIT
jgi:hypothetical protein